LVAIDWFKTSDGYFFGFIHACSVYEQTWFESFLFRFFHGFLSPYFQVRVSAYDAALIILTISSRSVLNDVDRCSTDMRGAICRARSTFAALYDHFACQEGR
jgi:hypothetical protein